MQAEAAIAAVHCKAASAAATDWRELANLYALLEGFRHAGRASEPRVRARQSQEPG